MAERRGGPRPFGRRDAALGMGGGLVWSVALLGLGARSGWGRGAEPLALAAAAMLGPALALGAIVARVAQRRFLDDALRDGGPPAPGSAAEADLRALSNTLEQAVLALCAWPALAVALPEPRRGAVLALGAGFVAARLLFWAGCHGRPRLRALGFAATFYPTALAGALAAWHLARG